MLAADEPPPPLPSQTDHQQLDESVSQQTRQAIAAAMKPKRVNSSKVFDDHLPFSWFHVLRTLFSYALLFSDIPRSGISVRDFASSATVPEPDAFLYFGPWVYPVTQLHSNETSTAINPKRDPKVWSYTFDMVPIVWRAYAEYFRLDAFPDYILYQSDCAFAHVSTSVAFNMIDSIPTAIAQGQQSQHLDYPDQPVTVSLHTQSYYFDKLHHYVLPYLSLNPSWRTDQVFYYPSQMLKSAGFTICFARNRNSRPNFSQSSWTNFRRSCPRDDAACNSVGATSDHIILRTRGLQSQFPDPRVDLTILESNEVSRSICGGIFPIGRRDVDISTIMQVHSCSTQLDHFGGPGGETELCETVIATKPGFSDRI